MPKKTLPALALCLLLCAAGAIGAETDLETLRGRLAGAFRQENWTAAIDVAHQIVDLDPRSSGAPYNLACAYARAGRPDEAVEWLTRAAERGFAYITTFSTDPDLDAVRDHPGFANALALVQANHRREFDAFKLKADHYEPLHFGPRSARRNGSAALIVALHGRGGEARTLFEAWKPVAKETGAVLVAPQSFDEFDGGGHHWLKVEEAVYHVLHAIDFAAERFAVDESRVVVTGFSQGGYIAFMAGSRHPERFAGVIPIGAYTDHAIAPPGAGVGAPRYYIGAGEFDRVLDGVRETTERFRAAGLEVELRVFDGIGHVFPTNHVEELGRALAFVLKEPR